MADLQWYEIVLIGLVFVWSGFVRSGLGFGGAVLALPFLLLIVNDPLIFLPIIAVHLLIFSGWIALKAHYRKQHSGESSAAGGTIHWQYLRRALRIIIIPKILGVIGLLTLSPKLMSIIIFTIVLGYAIGYIINRPIRHQSKAVDIALLSAGGYISGTSLTGAPLLITVFAAHVPKHQLRDTLFVLWFILTSIKLISFVIVGVDLQLIHHLWLLPCALVGHVLGERLHEKILASETPTFFRILGVALVIVSGAGIWQAMA
jgi:uncharacterized membrane protein YfcA